MSRRVCVTALLAAALAGCNSDGPFPVEGVVLLDGRPLDGAEVMFEPTARPPGQGSVAITGPDGRFRMETALGRGALRGEFKIVVRKVVGPPIPRGPIGFQPTPEMIAERKRAFAAALRAQKSVTPAVYGTTADTPLVCRVPLARPLVVELDSARHADKPFVHPEMCLAE